MDVAGLCQICGKPGMMFTCRLCGKLVCRDCFDAQHNTCRTCISGKTI